jgi:hypothetical protein
MLVLFPLGAGQVVLAVLYMSTRCRLRAIEAACYPVCCSHEVDLDSLHDRCCSRYDDVFDCGSCQAEA